MATDFQHDLHTLNDVLLESKKTEFTAKLNQNLDKSNEMKATMFKELESSKTEAIQNKPKQEDPRQNTTCQLIISLHNENKELTRKIGSYADDSDKKNNAMAKRNKNYETIAQRKSTLPEGLKNALDKILSK